MGGCGRHFMGVVLQDRVYVQGNEELNVYDLGLVIFKDEVRSSHVTIG